MFIIQKINVYDVEQFARKIASQIPEVEADPYGIDEYGEWQNEKEFDIEVEGEGITIVAIGTVMANGAFYNYMPQTHEHPAEAEEIKVTELVEITFFVDGLEVEVENSYEIESRINDLL